MIEVKRGQQLLGYVQQVDRGREWWLSWRPEDLTGEYPGPVGGHQDQGQAERFLAQLAGPC